MICRVRENFRQMCVDSLFKRRTHRQHQFWFWRIVKHSIYFLSFSDYSFHHFEIHQIVDAKREWALRTWKKKRFQKHFFHHRHAKQNQIIRINTCFFIEINSCSSIDLKKLKQKIKTINKCSKTKSKSSKSRRVVVNHRRRRQRACASISTFVMHKYT